jgi:DNA polymerase-3 subunit beta
MMGGELSEINQDTLKLVSLDGHRISIRKVKLQKSYGSRKVVVPGKTLSDISKIISDSTENNVDIFFTDKHILFEFDKTIVVSRLLEGEYFNIDQMLSSDYETKMTISRREMIDCIDRATLLVKEGDKKPVIISISDEKMELKINSTIGSMDEEIDIEKQGKDIIIGFNPKFLLDALRAIEDESIDIYMVNPKAPCFIRDKDSTYIYLVLPVNFTTVD